MVKSRALEDTEIPLHMSPILRILNRTSLVSQIVIGLIAGIALALLAPAIARDLAFLGKVFVSALKAVAPVLVFVLVMASIANHRHGQQTHIRPILFLYLLSTFAAAVVAVVASIHTAIDSGTPCSHSGW